MVSPVAPTPKPPRHKRGRNVVTGITLIGQMPALEHVRKGHVGKVWRVWLSYDDNYENGTYLQLEDNGRIVRYVVRGKQISNISVIKDDD